jgi:hypothetical protein
VAAITGADNGVDLIASNAFKPLTPEYPYPAPCFWLPVRLAHGVVDVDVSNLVGPFQLRGAAGQIHEELRGHRVQLANVPERVDPMMRFPLLSETR